MERWSENEKVWESGESDCVCERRRKGRGEEAESVTADVYKTDVCGERDTREDGARLGKHLSEEMRR